MFFFSVVILGEPFSARKLLLVLLCVAGVAIMTYGDRSSHDEDGGGGSTSESAERSNGNSDPSKTGSVRGDLLLLLPSVCNAL